MCCIKRNFKAEYYDKIKSTSAITGTGNIVTANVSFPTAYVQFWLRRLVFTKQYDTIILLVNCRSVYTHGRPCAYVHRFVPDTHTAGRMHTANPLL